MSPKKKPTAETFTNQQKINELWRRGVIAPLKLHSTQLDIYHAFKAAPGRKFVVNSARRLGKCLAEGTLVMTPSGPVKIEDLSPGDIIYGYNRDGSVSPTRVVAKEFQGIKTVHDLISSNKILATCTPDHRWLTWSANCSGTKVRKVSEFYQGVKIIKQHVTTPCGMVHEPHAYALGALLGDGNSKEGGNRIHISSASYHIPFKVQQLIAPDCFLYRQSEQSFTWIISSTPQGSQKGTSEHSRKLTCNHYDVWARGRKAHEKIADWDIIDTWDRESCMQFLAGLIDTDGSVGLRGNLLTLQLSMQARSVVEVFAKLLKKLYQIDVTPKIENRDKYVNGPMHYVSLRNNLHVSRILRSLGGRIVTDKKQWKDEYRSLPNRNVKENYVGVKIGEPYQAPCWDIQVDNETSLYLLANGLVTHNSWMLCVMALEKAMQTPNMDVKIATPNQKMTRKIIQPLMKQIMENCPKHLRPKFHATDGVFVFKNGSEIHVAGTEMGQVDTLRGTSCDLAIIDEAGFVNDLQYVLESVLMPQTLTRPGSRIIIASTPPVSPDHDFVRYIHQAMETGAYITKTIYDNPLLTPEQIEEYKIESGGEESTAWKREYLAQIVVDTEYAIFPELNEELLNKTVVDIQRPPFFFPITVADLGFVDCTGVLFGHYDFPRNKVVIEDEILVNKANSKEIVDMVMAKEKELWGDQVTPAFRIVDGPPMQLADLNALYGFNCRAPAKADLAANVNQTRVELVANRILINPRCKSLIYQLKSATWDKNRTKFTRTSNGGHWDLIAALIYLIRHIDRRNNPFPADYGYDYFNDFGFPRRHNEEALHVIASMFPTFKYK